MGFNDGYERKKFIEKQKAQTDEYRALGMTEEQIAEMSEFDWNQYRSARVYAMHTQSLSDTPFPEDGDEGEESKSPLFERFLRELSTNIGSLSELSRYGWVDEIDDPRLAARLKKLPPDDLELLTLLVFDGYSQNEIAAVRYVTQQAISKKINRIKKYLNLRL